MNTIQDLYKSLPGVDVLLEKQEIQSLVETYNVDTVKFAIREVLNEARKEIGKHKKEVRSDVIIHRIKQFIEKFYSNSLKTVYNATGVIVHTNLGRAPFSKELIAEASKTLLDYNNLEFNLKTGERGSRHEHLSKKLKYLTGAEDVLVINNNAAAVMLILRTFAKDKEVVVSRGELIEIGGSFRLPEIMAASDCIMAEVGSTNKTHLKDYENAINEQTAMLFKAHRSNYVIQGFTKEIELPELVTLGKKHKIPVVYDMGSGLLRKTNVEILKQEPDVKQTLTQGVDLVCFSGDKLIGGPQAGIIAGKRTYIEILKKEPMVRALRVGKTTLAFMEAALNYYLDDDHLVKNNGIFNMLHQNPAQIRQKASKLKKALAVHNIPSEVVETDAYCGGGALPGEKIASYGVRITGEFRSGKDRSGFAERLYYGLLANPQPVAGILKQGELYLNTMTIPGEAIDEIATIVSNIYKSIA